jgi:hypothetical protein
MVVHAEVASQPEDGGAGRRGGHTP